MCRLYTEEQPGDAAVMLFIKNLHEKDSGTYTCEGVYANNEKMVTKVSITTFSEFNKHSEPLWITEIATLTTKIQHGFPTMPLHNCSKP